MQKCQKRGYIRQNNACPMHLYLASWKGRLGLAGVDVEGKKMGPVSMQAGEGKLNPGRK